MPSYQTFTTARRFAAQPLRLALLLCTLALLAVRVSPASAAPASPALASRSAAVEMLTLMNSERAHAGLQPLSLSAKIDGVANLRALDMASHAYFAHYNADGVGAQRLLDGGGVPYHVMGENIARTTEPSNYSLETLLPAVHAALMASEHHRENVLEPRFQQVGIAVAVVNAEYYFAVVFTG